MAVVGQARELVALIRTLVSGYGHWGKILTRNLIADPDFFVVGVHDPSSEARASAEAINLPTFERLGDAFDATPIHLVVIASPIGSQYQTAIHALSRYANVMLAKPGATRMVELERIDRLARKKGRVAAIDYTMRNSLGFDALCRDARGMGELQHVECERFSVSSRSSAPILHDMMVHDIALVCAMRNDPWEIIGVDKDDAYVRVVLRSGECWAVLTAGTDAIEPVRIMRISGALGSAEWNQLEADGREVSETPVGRSLSRMASAIRRHDHNMSFERKVTTMLEGIGAA